MKTELDLKTLHPEARRSEAPNRRNQVAHMISLIPASAFFRFRDDRYRRLG